MAGVAEILGTDVVVNGKGENVNIEEICKDKVAIGIYFSAHWCPPCRGFTPVLANFYEKHSKQFECIFVSSDRDETSFKDYFKEMPWHALDYSKRGFKEAVSKKYGVQGIPTLVILKPDGTLISANGRGDVTSAGDNFPKQWLEKTSGDNIKSVHQPYNYLRIYFGFNYITPTYCFIVKLLAFSYNTTTFYIVLQYLYCAMYTYKLLIIILLVLYCMLCNSNYHLGVFNSITIKQRFMPKTL